MEQTKKCEICGEIKSSNDFSKSYKHRCKKCVAEHTRLVRSECRKPIEYEKEVDWEQRRYEAAKNAMVGLMAGHHTIYDAEKLASVAVKYADALIEELKKHKNEDSI